MSETAAPVVSVSDDDLAIRTLRPGLLVALSTRTNGNRSYVTEVIEPEHVTDDGIEQSRWETTRIVADPDEYARATKVRSKARSLVTGVCSASGFGLLCPESKAPELIAAVAEARRIAAEFNDNSQLTQVTVNVIYGRIAADDTEAVRAITGEISDLMATMERGIAALDVKSVRDACNRARDLGQMLSVDAKRQVDDAVAAARAAARKIGKAGEVAALELDAAILDKISTARTAFLDLSDDDNQVEAPVHEGRAVEFAPETDDYSDLAAEDLVTAESDDDKPAAVDTVDAALAQMQGDPWAAPTAPAAPAAPTAPAFDLEF